MTFIVEFGDIVNFTNKNLNTQKSKIRERRIEHVITPRSLVL